ncbi:MAG: hypothetical protein IPH62_03235 [Ignavibacteriae bacterium]|nr:hypothetical protein [Ignavibacteriota bacterium]
MKKIKNEKLKVIIQERNCRHYFYRSCDLPEILKFVIPACFKPESKNK